MLLSWQEIIKYREWALIELRIEAKRFVQSGIEVKPHNLTFTDIWVKCVDAEEIKMKGVSRNEFYKLEDIELSFKEKTALYEILATDTDMTLMSFMNGDTVNRDSLKFQLDLEISSITVIATELVLEDDLERVNEFEALSFLNICKCDVCQRKHMSKLFDPTKNRGSKRDLPKIPQESLTKPAKTEMLQQQEHSKGLNFHLEDLYHDVEYSQHPSLAAPDDQKLIKPKKDVKIIEPRSVNECMNIVCFIEILNIGGKLQTKRDGSLCTNQPFSIADILIFDTTMLSKINPPDLPNSSSTDDGIKFNLKRPERQESGESWHSNMHAQFSKSRIMSYAVCDTILK